MTKKIVRFTYYVNSSTVEMKASSAWILNHWDKFVTSKMTQLGTNNRVMFHPALREVVVYYLSVSIDNDSSRAIINERNPIFYSFENFSSAYCAFIKYFGNYFYNDVEMGFGTDFYELWYSRDKADSRSTDVTFFEENEGYIEFLVEKREPKKKGKYIFMVKMEHM